MNFDLLGLYFWIVAGVVALSRERVTKVEYVLCWSGILYMTIFNMIQGG